MRVAIIHDWLNGMRGGEKVLEALCELFPDSVIFTLFYQPDKVSKIISRHEVRASYLNSIPGSKKYYRYLLPFYSKAITSFNLEGFDLCISISHSVAKGISPPPNCLHICICLTPMRYIWDRFDDYFGPNKSGWIKRFLAKRTLASLRRWDVESSNGVDLFIAISEFVKNRIQKFYGRNSTVIYPFADTDFYKPLENSPKALLKKEESYFLAVSALVPYKRIHEIVKAFEMLDERLIIVGDGPEKKKLMAQAKSNIQFTGWLSNDKLLHLYQNCEALIFPGVEDFGIVPVEAQACGKPVIALAEGGALETIAGFSSDIGKNPNSSPSGLFFKNSGAENIAEAVRQFRQMKFDSDAIRKNSLRFSRAIFDKKIKDFIDESCSVFSARGRRNLERDMLRGVSSMDMARKD